MVRSFKLDIEDKHTKSKASFHLTGLENTSKDQQKQLSNKMERVRKVRSDKKSDIKAPITMEQKQKLKILARQESLKTGSRVSITQMASLLVQEGLFEYETFPESEYDPSWNTVHVKLTKFYCDQLFNFELEWDVSKKAVAARILSYMLEKRHVDEV
jgi:hypothetical protein